MEMRLSSSDWQKSKKSKLANSGFVKGLGKPFGKGQ